MKVYTIKFIGRLSGALGVTYHIIDTRGAATIEQAILALYDQYEHIRVITVTCEE